jgi:hypothetical protein
VEQLCRFIPVGNEFNGLFTEAKEKPSELLDVPLEIFGKPKVLDPSRGTTANLLVESLGLRRRRLLRTQEEKGRAWLQGSYLAVCTMFCTRAICMFFGTPQPTTPVIPPQDVTILNDGLLDAMHAQTQCCKQFWKTPNSIHDL